MIPDARVVACRACGEDFETPRGPGRPPGLCSDDCRREDSRHRLRRRYETIQAAQRELERLQATLRALAG